MTARRGFAIGDPRATAAAKKGEAASRETRRQRMWRRFMNAAGRCESKFDAFILGWKAHREFSSRRRTQGAPQDDGHPPMLPADRPPGNWQTRSEWELD